MTDERVRRAVAARVGKISISIDGLERTHDAIRGSTGSWKAAVAAARRISANGIDLSVNTQMNRLTMPELPAVADLLVDIGARSWMVILTAAMGRAADRPRCFCIPITCFISFRCWPTSNAKNSIQMNRFLPGQQCRLLRAARGNASLRRESRPHVGRLRRRRFGARHRSGRQIKGCPSLPTSDYAGKYPRTFARDIASQLAQERTASPTELWGFCKSCPYAQRCRAGCTWTSHVLFGRPGNNPFCHSRALSLAEAGLVEKIEPVSRRRVSRSTSDITGSWSFRPGRHRIRSRDRDDQGQPDVRPPLGCGRVVVEARTL